MKIGILTQPLRTNYGGLLQAFALQVVLKRMGHEVWTVDRSSKEITLFIKIYSIIRRCILYVFHKNITTIRVWTTTKEQKIIGQHTNRFIAENIRITEAIDSPGKLSLVKNYKFDAYIVGSDQVWRPIYSPCITNYFLDFIDKGESAKRIAYAASFGVGDWEFTPEQTIQCAALAKAFNAISVRENSAVKLCREFLGINATHVLDPTMLLTKEDYIKLIEKDNIPKSKGTLMTYVLDESSDTIDILQKVFKETQFIPFSVLPNHKFEEKGSKDIENCIFPPVTEWLRGFMDADFVVTDSFHGTVFAIIFNKPFISIGNIDRGIDRFSSLLNTFGLEDRLIKSKDELTTKLIKSPIDYNKVNKIKQEQQNIALSFLHNALK